MIELMEGVEDIPGVVLHEGLEWTWESFPEYLDAVEARPRDIDVCALLPSDSTKRQSHTAIINMCKNLRRPYLTHIRANILPNREND